MMKINNAINVNISGVTVTAPLFYPHRSPTLGVLDEARVPAKQFKAI